LLLGPDEFFISGFKCIILYRWGNELLYDPVLMELRIVILSCTGGVTNCNIILYRWSYELLFYPVLMELRIAILSCTDGVTNCYIIYELLYYPVLMKLRIVILSCTDGVTNCYITLFCICNSDHATAEPCNHTHECQLTTCEDNTLRVSCVHHECTCGGYILCPPLAMPRSLVTSACVVRRF